MISLILLYLFSQGRLFMIEEITGQKKPPNDERPK
jgi:hypothetical protein